MLTITILMKNSSKCFLGIATVFALEFALSCQMVPMEGGEILRDVASEELPPRPIIVAVIDTGFDFKSDWKKEMQLNPGLKKPRMCKYGSKDYTGLGIEDHHGHGTHVSGIIAQYADGENYCIVMMKFYDHDQDNMDHLTFESKAFQRAINLKVDIINYSGGGVEKSDRECALIKKALDAGIIVVAAAGNEASDLNKVPYYPAMCDKRVTVVANVGEDGKLVQTSNYSNDVEKNSTTLYKEKGQGVLSILPNNSSGSMTGTSQAAAIKTGKIIKDWKNR